MLFMSWLSSRTSSPTTTMEILQCEVEDTGDDDDEEEEKERTRTRCLSNRIIDRILNETKELGRRGKEGLQRSTPELRRSPQSAQLCKRWSKVS